MKTKLRYGCLKLGSVIAYAFLPVVTFAQLEGAGISYKLTSFIKVDSIEGLLSAILSIFIVIATPIIVLYIIYAGFLYVTARGNAEQIKTATTALTYAIIGGVIIIGSVAISVIFKNIVDSFTAT